MSKQCFAHTNPAYAQVTEAKEGRTLLVSSSGYPAIWCKQMKNNQKEIIQGTLVVSTQ
jgi:hypothetical protein